MRFRSCDPVDGIKDQVSKECEDKRGEGGRSVGVSPRAEAELCSPVDYLPGTWTTVAI